MSENIEDLKLQAEHTKEAIRLKLQQGPRHSYLKDFVYGAVDGIVTTFAVVGGVVGADLSYVVIIVLGMANIVADGFSMAVSNFLGTKAEVEVREQAKQMELDHIERVPDGEREEIRQIYEAKGFKGEDLERVVKTITSDKEIWVETMLQEEFGLPKEIPSPVLAAGATFIAFALFGFLPLIPFMGSWIFGSEGSLNFLISSIITGCAFFIVGALKSKFLGMPWLKAGIETLLVGGFAASMAYGVGFIFRGVFN